MDDRGILAVVIVAAIVVVITVYLLAFWILKKLLNNKKRNDATPSPNEAPQAPDNTVKRQSLDFNTQPLFETEDE